MTRALASERLALSMLVRHGIAAVWQLHLAAADAHRTGHTIAAASIVEIADAAEDAWLVPRECASSQFSRLPHALQHGEQRQI